MKAHNTAGKSTASLSSKKSIRTKLLMKSAKRKPTGVFPSTDTMCKCDATAVSSATLRSTAGLSFAGNTMRCNGSVALRQKKKHGTPVFCTVVKKAIGGALGFSQCDSWVDNGLNRRASIDLMASNGVVIDGNTLQCHPSTMQQDAVAISFCLSGLFMNIVRKLACLLEHVADAFQEILLHACKS